MNCPICNSKMDTHKYKSLVMDGNIVWQCPEHRDHRFFKNLREANMIHQDPNATSRSHNPHRTWEYETITTYKFTEG